MQKITFRKLIGENYIYPELQGHFIEFLGSCIYDGIWVGEDSEIPNYHGIRKDLVDAFQKLHPPVIRWPGGCYADVYHWRNGIGPRENRPVTYNENFGTFETDPNQFGTHEMMEFCEMIGAKPWFNINMMTGSPAEMREWMEYCNRQESTTLTRERKVNGHEAPFQVEYWGIGNEVWDGGGKMTPQMYANEYRKFTSSCPSFGSGDQAFPPKCIASGPDGNKPKERVAWTKDFFKEMGKYRMPSLYGYDLHFYNWNLKQLQTEKKFDEKQWYDVINGCKELENVIHEQRRLIDAGLETLPKPEGPFQAAPRKCELIVGEWGNWHSSAFNARPALYQQCTMRDAVTTALTLDIFHRNTGDVRMACVAQSVNVLNSLFLTDGEHCILTPNYDVFDMYQVHQGAYTLGFEEKNKDPEVCIFASIKNDDIYVNLVNTSYSESKKIELKFKQCPEFVEAKTLYSKDPQNYNDAKHPNRVRCKEGKAPAREKDSFQIALPAASVSVYHFRKTETEK